MELTDEQKCSMPSTQQKNSLAVVKNLAQLPDHEAGAGEHAAAGKRARSPSRDRAHSPSCDRVCAEPKLQRTHSLGPEGRRDGVAGLLELGEVCEWERERIQDTSHQIYTAMKPPTPVNISVTIISIYLIIYYYL